MAGFRFGKCNLCGAQVAAPAGEELPEVCWDCQQDGGPEQTLLRQRAEREQALREYGAETPEEREKRFSRNISYWERS
jgi:ribosome-binding protein aMBF1 (putative translation factor)